MDSEEIGIYKIVAPSQKTYVGMNLKSFTQRWAWHKKDLRGGRHKCRGLQYAANKYGVDTLLFEQLECWNSESITELSLETVIPQREVEWWDTLSRNGIRLYNARPNGSRGATPSPQMIETHSRLLRARWEEGQSSLYDRRAEIITLLHDPSFTLKAITARLGLSSVSTLETWLEHEGLVNYWAPENTVARRALELGLTRLELNQEIIDFRRTHSTRETAAHFGLSMNAIWTELKRNFD